MTLINSTPVPRDVILTPNGNIDSVSGDVLVKLLLVLLIIIWLLSAVGVLLGKVVRKLIWKE